MARYVDGYVLVVPKTKVKEYTKMAQEGAKTWMKAGALQYMECMGDDLNPKMQKGWEHLLFTTMAHAKSNETVWFSFIVYKSRKHRDAVNAKVEKEMEKQTKKQKDMKMPFDMKKLAFGGFEVMVER